jgi:hypothetical protein
VAEEKRFGEGFSDAPWKRGKPDGRVPEAQSAGHLMAEMNPTTSNPNFKDDGNAKTCKYSAAHQLRALPQKENTLLQKWCSLRHL